MKSHCLCRSFLTPFIFVFHFYANKSCTYFVKFLLVILYTIINYIVFCLILNSNYSLLFYRKTIDFCILTFDPKPWTCLLVPLISTLIFIISFLLLAFKLNLPSFIYFPGRLDYNFRCFFFSKNALMLQTAFYAQLLLYSTNFDKLCFHFNLVENLFYFPMWLFWDPLLI